MPRRRVLQSPVLRMLKKAFYGGMNCIFGGNAEHPHHEKQAYKAICRDVRIHVPSQNISQTASYFCSTISAKCDILYLKKVNLRKYFLCKTHGSRICWEASFCCIYGEKRKCTPYLGATGHQLGKEKIL